ncbi:MAG: HAD-IC family P-type ATPase [Rubrivivax sp.]|nr:HAD-IC family P-type ATPase [Rubrivivax sp.]
MTPRLSTNGPPGPDARSVAPAAPVWHALGVAQVLMDQGSKLDSGLGRDEAELRLQQHGRNNLPAARRRAAWLRLALQFHNPLIYVLLAATAVTFALDDLVDASVIMGVVLINALIGYVQEGKAEKALEAVSAMLASHATVRRDGAWQQIDAALLVPGDVVQLESGDRVPADLRLLHVKNLRIDEAALTGESVAADKGTEAVAEDAPIGDRGCMAYSGTVVSVGQAQGVVVATGKGTEIGRIGTMVGEVDTLATPLTRRLDQFALRITLFIVVVGLITFAYGYFWRGLPLLDIFLAVVGLAVAAIPEGLPAIVTIVLAIGTRNMARNKAIVRRLPAVETLGSVTVICSDKTGTLTKNEMTAVRVMLAGHTLQVSGAGYAPDGGFQRDGVAVDAEDDAGLLALAQCALLCNNAQLRQGRDSEGGDDAAGWQLVGDPTEGALLALAHKAGLDAHEAASATPRIDEIPFESEHRYMATLHHDPAGQAFVLLKGAPERVLDLCTHQGDGQPLDRSRWEQRMNEAADAGQRVLALARRDMPAGTTALSSDDIGTHFTLLGLAGLIDPPREEAIAAVAECQAAGLRVKMITGDHAGTAAAIGRQLGLNADAVLTGATVQKLNDEELRRRALDSDIVARASPEHKLRLVRALQAEGELVAMTGDGVNDAPALKTADIGVAMGHKGTDAARQAADLVLTDDNFATIALAVREGRVVFDNIRKALLFILPTSGGEAGVILIAVFAGFTLPVTAGQVLWVNLVTAVTLALALAFEPAEADVMQRPPRSPQEPLVTRMLALRIAYVSALMMAVTFAAFQWELARGSSTEVARTAAVNMLVASELVYLFAVRRFTASALTRHIFSGNPVALWMSALLIVLQLAFTYAPPLQRLFQTQALDGQSWLVIAGLSALLFLAVEAGKAVLRRRGAAGM